MSRERREDSIANDAGSDISSEESSGISISSDENISLSDMSDLRETSLDNMVYTPLSDAAQGFMGAIGGGVGAGCALIWRESPHFLEITAINTAMLTFVFALTASCVDNTNGCNANTLLKLATVMFVVMAASTADMSAGAAVAVGANVTELGPMAALTAGTSGLNVLITTVAGLLAGRGFFKARECLGASNVQNDSDLEQSVGMTNYNK